MKKTAVILAALAVAAGTAYGQAWRTGSLDDALAEAKAENKLLLLDFYQESG